MSDRIKHPWLVRSLIVSGIAKRDDLQTIERWSNGEVDGYVDWGYIIVKLYWETSSGSPVPFPTSDKIQSIGMSDTARDKWSRRNTDCDEFASYVPEFYLELLELTRTPGESFGLESLEIVNNRLAEATTLPPITAEEMYKAVSCSMLYDDVLDGNITDVVCKLLSNTLSLELYTRTQRSAALRKINSILIREYNCTQVSDRIVMDALYGTEYEDLYLNHSDSARLFDTAVSAIAKLVCMYASKRKLTRYAGNIPMGDSPVFKPLRGAYKKPLYMTDQDIEAMIITSPLIEKWSSLKNDVERKEFVQQSLYTLIGLTKTQYP